MICPFATYKPVSNHGGKMIAVNGLVLHVQVGIGSLYGLFNNPTSQVSAHFWAAKNGLIEQYVDTNIVAWAESNGNPYYLSVETEGFPNEPLTPEQVSSVATLLRWSSDNYNFPITGPVPHGAKGFTPHCNPDGTPDPAWGGHPCPEAIRLGQMPQIISLAQGPLEPPEDIEVTSEISGGQLHVWGIVNNVPLHWWQAVGGAGGWHVEQLPMP